MKRQSITPKQVAIIRQLYTYRYLDRLQIQKILLHKDKRRIQVWLKDLRERQFIGWIYSTDFTQKTKPAIYYLSTKGIRYLRDLDVYPTDELRKRYKDNNRSGAFIGRSLAIANCAVELTANRSGFYCVPNPTTLARITSIIFLQIMTPYVPACMFGTTVVEQQSITLSRSLTLRCLDTGYVRG